MSWLKPGPPLLPLDLQCDEWDCSTTMGALKGHLSSEGNVPSFLKPSLENKYEVGKNQIELLAKKFFFAKCKNLKEY